MFEALIVFLLPSLILAALNIVASTAFARHKLRTEGTKYSRLYFVLLTLTVSQLVFLLSAVSILAATVGFALFAGTLFIFANGIASLIAVLIAAIGYDVLIGRAYSQRPQETVYSPRVAGEWAKAIIASAFLACTFTFLGGISTIRDIVIEYAVKTTIRH